MRLTEDIFLSIIDTVFAGGEKLKRFKDWLIRFMYGRYGVDQLYYGLFGLWIILTVVGCGKNKLCLLAYISEQKRIIEQISVLIDNLTLLSVYLTHIKRTIPRGSIGIPNQVSGIQTKRRAIDYLG